MEVKCDRVDPLYNDTLYNSTSVKSHWIYIHYNCVTAIRFNVSLLGNERRRCKEGWLSG